MTTKDKPSKQKIGTLLLSEGFISENQLREAVAIQNGKNNYTPLGEVLVEMKYISKLELKDILKKYQKKLYLGELLVNMGLLSHEEVKQALEAQKIEGKKLGKILIERGYLTESCLINTLSTQLGIPKIIPTAGLIDPSVLKGISKAFIQRNECLPAFRNGDKIVVIMSDPLSDETIKILENMFKCKIEPAIAGSSEIQKGIKLIYDDLKMLDTAADKSAKNAHRGLVIGDSASVDQNEGNIVDIANFIISGAIEDGASDIHIEPMEHMLRVRYRIDGILKHKTDLPLAIAVSLVSRIKALCGMDISDKRKHHTGRLDARVMNKGFDLRVSTYASVNGECVAIRILHKESNLIDLDVLGFSPTNLIMFKRILDIPSGIIMVSGPSSCGKTTSLYAALRHLNSIDKKVITVEDPIEYKMDGVIQGQISESTGLLYTNFIKSMLRQDPDVIMVGEIRDKESAVAVIEAALTGHKVLTSFHTDDTTSAMLRMFEIGVESFLISSTIMSVMTQRLVRTLCPSCKEPYIPDENILSYFDSIYPINFEKHMFYTSTGCFDCDNTGFKGQTMVNELMVVNNEIRDAIQNKMPSAQIRHIARQSSGLISMREDAFYKATKGLTSLEEITRVVPYNEIDAQTARSSEDIVSLCEKGFI